MVSKFARKLAMKQEEYDRLLIGAEDVSLMFRNIPAGENSYAEFDVDGIPTKTKEGEILTEKGRKKFAKPMELRRKANAQLAEKMQDFSDSTSFFACLGKELEALKVELARLSL